MEDAMIINKASHDRGIFDACIYKTEVPAIDNFVLPILSSNTLVRLYMYIALRAHFSILRIISYFYRKWTWRM